MKLFLFILRHSVFFLYLILGIFSSFIIVVSTEKGSVFIIQAVLSQQKILEVSEIEGKLIDSIILKDIIYHDPQGENLSIEYAKVHWSLKDFWQGKLALEQVIIQKLTYNIPVTKQTPSNTNNEIPTLLLPEIKAPFPIQIKQILLEDIQTNLFSIKQVNLALDWQEQFDVKIHWQAANLLSDWQFSQGELSLQGDIKNYALNFKTQLSHPEIKTTDIIIKAQGNQSSIHLNQAIIAQKNSQVITQGDIVFYPKINTDLNIQGVNMDIQPYLSQIESQFDFNLDINLALAAQGLTGKVHLKQLTGSLYQYPIEAQLLAEIKHNNQYTIENLLLKVANNTAKLTGEYNNEKVIADWNINFSDISQLYKPVTGKVISQGKIKADLKHLEQAKISGEVFLKKINWQDILIQQAKLKADIIPEQNSQIELSIDNLKYQTQSIRSLAIKAQGLLNQHQFSVLLDSSLGEILLVARGGYKMAETLWQGQLLDLNIKSYEFKKSLALIKSTNISLSPQKADIKELCLQLDSANLCQDIAWSAITGIQAKGDWQNITTADFKDFLPQEIQLETQANIQWQIAQQALDWLGDISITLKQILIAYPEVSEIEDIIIEPTYIKLALKPKQITLDLPLSIKALGLINIKAQVDHTQFDLASAQLKATMQAPQLVLDKLSPFIPETIKDFSGTTAIDIVLHGSLLQPKIEAKIKGIIPKLTVIPLNKTFENITLNISNQDINTLLLNAAIYSGKEKLSIDGNIIIDPKQGYPLLLKIQGEQFALIDIPEAFAKISPDLSVSFSLKTPLMIKGDLVIPQAKITLLELPPETVNVSSDIVIIEETPTQNPIVQKDFPLEVRVNLSLGEEVAIDAFNFKSNLIGKLLIMQKDEKLSAQGNLNIIEGRYKAYNQSLVIETGQLLFSGPVDNPGLNIKAVRPNLPNNQIAGVLVRGNVKNPQVSLFAEPSLSQADILAYLLLGRSLSQAKQSEGALLLSAISSLRLEAGEVVSNQISERLGIDVLRFDAGAEDPGLFSGVTIGKYLSPKLYLEFVRNLLTNRNTIRLQYQLNKHWQIQVEGGEESAVDLIYSIEK